MPSIIMQTGVAFIKDKRMHDEVLIAGTFAFKGENENIMVSIHN